MTMSELHLIVLWELAREQESRILADVPNHLELVHSEVLQWPSDPAVCYGRFYGANLEDVQCKVRTCGGGPFLVILVRDRNPEYGLRETSRGLERVNLKLFDLKMRYRSWTGGGHKVHTTNSSEEAKRDVLLLTGHTVEDWEKGRAAGALKVLPGQDGWGSLRELFGFLGRVMPYVVLRNAETLPDRFDPAVHGDIDLLVPDARACASVLGARKVFPEAHRVHYEVRVGGRPVRFDFRFVGDGYYDRKWERDMLSGHIERDGVFLLPREDAFYALVYHAVYQKREIAADYPGKAKALAAAAGISGISFDDWLPALEEFLKRRGYGKPVPQDTSVFWNGRTVGWQDLAAEISELSGVTDIRPFRLEDVRGGTPLKTFFLSGRYGERSCFIKYSPFARGLTAAEWRMPQTLAETEFGLFVRPLFWHVTRDGGAFVVQEMVDGTPLETLIRRNDPILRDRAETVAGDLTAIAEALDRAGIVHRDVRPANLLVRPDGHVTLIDFQFAIRRDAVREDAFLQQNPRILYVLGEEYAPARGRWNDAHAIRAVLRLLPQSVARDAAINQLEPLAARPTRVASCSKGMMKYMRRRLRRLRRKKLLAKFFKSRRRKLDRRFEAEFEALTYAVANWDVTN